MSQSSITFNSFMFMFGRACFGQFFFCDFYEELCGALRLLYFFVSITLQNYQPDYQLNYQPDYQPDSSEVYQSDSNRSISLIISLIVIVRTELLCAAASRLMLRSTSRRDATPGNLSATYTFTMMHMSTHPYVTRSATAAATQQGDSTCTQQLPHIRSSRSSLRPHTLVLYCSSVLRA